MTQLEEDDQSIIADIYKNSTRMASVKKLCTHKPMEDIHEPEVSQVLLRSLFLNQLNEATNSNYN